LDVDAPGLVSRSFGKSSHKDEERWGMTTKIAAGPDPLAQFLDALVKRNGVSDARSRPDHRGRRRLIAQRADKRKANGRPA
jgi:hypothetical protein